jgi:aminoglycoside phosphotransferase (APT) family kinase protein/putative sterol carrier protein
MKNEKDAIGRIMSDLLPWLRERMPRSGNLAISDMQKPGMGLSNETYLLDLTWEEGGARRSQAMVLRCAPQDHKVFPDYHLSHQFLIMKALRNTDVPVPEMYWLEEDGSIIGAPFYLMERLYGLVPQDYPSYHGTGMYFEATPEQRARIWWGSLETLARINMVDWRSLGLDFLGAPGGGSDPIDRQLAYWDRYFDWIRDDPAELHPVLERAMQWLDENKYEPERVCLCWGDARIGNTLYRPEDLSVMAAFDWEMAFLGDPEADLAWFIFIDRYLAEEYGLQRLEGSPEWDEAVARYEAFTGWKVRNYAYNQVFAAARFGMILVSVLKKMRRQGIPIEDDMLLNNTCTRTLAELLGLEPPGGGKRFSNIHESRVTVQFNLTGPDGHDWFIVSDRGKAARHEGMVDDPTCLVRANAEDWRALQSGELNQLEAWSTGRLVVEGDLNVMMQLKEVISRLDRERSRSFPTE